VTHIVIIEDHPDNARLAEKLLKHAGYEVTVAEDGETGLQVVLEQLPDRAKRYTAYVKPAQPPAQGVLLSEAQDNKL
jgi:CheY-like chemotaxis protein